MLMKINYLCIAICCNVWSAMFSDVTEVAKL
jgi:hypothetical protein